MKCTIPSLNIKSFGKAIQSMAKIGEEISIEPTADGLLLKSMNSTRSCLAQFTFQPRFFQHYDDGNSGFLDGNIPRFRLSAKGILSIFKSLHSMDKLVEKCTIDSNQRDRIVFSLHCKHGMVKTYNLTYMESDPLNCAIQRSSCPNFIKADSKLFTEVISSFPHHIDEITMVPTAQNLSFHNYTDADSEKDPMKSFTTVMTLHQDEFEIFNVESETSVSFCIKEFKAALAFAEFTNVSVSLHFDTGGMPMFISMDTDPGFDVVFITSTISENSSCHSNTGINQSRIASQSMTESKTSNRSTPASSHVSSRVKGDSNSRREVEIHPPSASTSCVETKPLINELMNDSSITLLPPETRSPARKRHDDIDALLKEIDSESCLHLQPSSTKKAKSILFKKRPSKPAFAIDEEVLAADTDEETEVH